MMHAYHLGTRRLEAGGSGVHSRAELPVSSVLACATDARNQYPKSKQRKEPPQRESYNVEMALWVSVCSTSSEDLSLYVSPSPPETGCGHGVSLGSRQTGGGVEFVVQQSSLDADLHVQ